MTHVTTTRSRRWLVFGLLLAGTTLGLAGTDLVLPAITVLPDALGGSAALAQGVLAAYVAGAGAGLVGFGELGARFDQRNLLVASLLAFAGLSLMAPLAPDMNTLIALRFLQGAAGAAAAVYAPGMIKALFEERDAVHALGILGSIESVIPALAPVAGVWLLAQLGWSGSFTVTGVLALLASGVLLAARSVFPAMTSRRGAAGYSRLARDPVFARYALSQAFTLGGLLTFVFGAPVVMTEAMGGSLTHFVTMQISGIACFVIASNLTSRLSERFGAETLIMVGSWLSAAGCLSTVLYALSGVGDPAWLALLFIPVNVGLGLRGPPGFYRAVLAAKGNESRGSALVLLAILLMAALGTVAAAPFVTTGLLPLALIASGIAALSPVVLMVLPALNER